MKKLFILLAAMLTFTSTAFAQIGSASVDLVYTPVTPCRIFDTRVSQGGTGPIPAAGTKNFLVWGVSSYASQGGAATNCGLLAPGSNVAAAAINFTVVSPATPGFITAFPFGATRPTAATVNFNAGDVRGNFSIAKNAQGGASDLSVFSTSNVEVVADVVGYFSRPISAGSFECVDVYASTSTTVAAGTDVCADAPACAAGSVETSKLFDNIGFGGLVISQMNGPTAAGTKICGRNTGSGSTSFTPGARCCRIPGR